MPASKAHQRSFTISIRALTPATSQPTNPSGSSNPKSRFSHSPSKSTPNAIAIMTAGVEVFPGLAAAGLADPDSLPRHNRELTLRRYLLLQEEHEIIRHHLDELSACSTPSTTATTSPVASPTRGAIGHSRQHRRSDSATRRASAPQFNASRGPARSRTSGRGPQRAPMGLITSADKLVIMEGEDPVMDAAMVEMASEEARLFTINEGIKRSLTELLNCETTRSDQTFRQWVMSRLMEVEQELRVGRRRRSCPID